MLLPAGLGSGAQFSVCAYYKTPSVSCLGCGSSDLPFFITRLVEIVAGFASGLLSMAVSLLLGRFEADVVVRRLSGSDAGGVLIASKSSFRVF
jgi:hypothetical protein